jgi:hypothetical protein
MLTSWILVHEFLHAQFCMSPKDEFNKETSAEINQRIRHCGRVLFIHASIII